MKRILLFSFLILAFCSKSNAQSIPYVTSDSSHDPVISETSSIGDAVGIIMDFLTQYAGMRCSNTLNSSLKPKIDSVRSAYIATIPAGKKVSFLVFTDAFNCKVNNIVREKQTIYMQNNACSVDDVQLEDQDYIYDPSTTGFFRIYIQF